MLTGVVAGFLVLLTSFQSLTAHPLDCNFENGACAWMSIHEKWKIRSGEFYPTGPDNDHTTGNGSYMAMTSGFNLIDGKAILLSPFVKSTNGSCLTFWYYMYGFQVDSLAVYKTERKGAKKELFQVSGNQGKKWFKATVDTGSGRFFVEIIATNKNHGEFGNIAIDDTSFSPDTDCVIDEARRNAPVFDCDFETDFCFWSSPHRARSNWSSKRVTVSPNDISTMTFPPDSHGSSFLKIQRSHRYGSDDEVLMAPAIRIGKDGACLSFWFKAHEPRGHITSFAIKKSGIGSFLEEYEQMISGGDILLQPISEDRRKWSTPDLWNFAQATLPPGDDYFVYFQVTFILWSDPYEYINVDDIELDEDGACKPENLVNCDFEDGYCRWFTPNGRGEPEWPRRKGPTPTAFTGPPGDHTTGGGYYIHYRDLQVQGQSPRIRTPVFDVGSNGACFTFWYYMYGKDIKSLTILAKSRSREYPQRAWIKRGNQGDQWLQGNMSIEHPGEIFLTFIATKGYFPRADIAVDDISISFDGLCEEDRSTDSATTESTTETVTTTTTQVRKWLPSPVLTINGDTKPALVNSRVEIICGDPLDGASYTWLKKDEHDFTVIEGQDKRILLFDNIQLSQEGTYLCSVTKEGYLTADSRKFDIAVVKPQLPNPRVTVTGMANPVYQNSRIELNCLNSDDTELSYEWHKFQENKTKDLSEKSGMLVFDEIRFEDSANYSCIVHKDGYLSAESENVEIKVVEDPRPAPTLYTNVENSPLQRDKRIEFNCGHVDVEGGVFHWKTNSAAFATSPPPNQRHFVIEKSDSSHNGVYSCRISKDGYFTAKSRNVHIKVVPGKPCSSRYSCWGSAHSGKCVKRRCQCAQNAVLRGNSCVERPKAPSITASPDYSKFAYGETFYLICKVREPVPKSLTYKFKKSSDVLRREGVHGTYYIHKVANATSRDSGSYACAVTEDGIASEYSKSVYINVKKFLDLNCDFENQDTCSWLHGDDPHSVNFTIEEHSPSSKSRRGLSNWYLQMPPSRDKQIHSAVLRTPTIDNSKLKSCLSFRYYMHGPGVYSLAVWKYSDLWQDHPDRHNLWTAIGDQGNTWVRKKLTIESHHSIYLQFEAVGDVAIDDIRYLYRGSCSKHY